MATNYNKLKSTSSNKDADEELLQTKAIRVDGTPTVISYAGNIKDCEVCVVLVPGNPGIVEFYEVFLESLYTGCKSNVSVVGVSHAGHSPIWCYADKSVSYKEACGKSLNYQVQHKIQFIQEHISENTKLVLIGHSVGAWIVLQMLENEEVAKRSLKSILLFPTIENLAATPNGRFWKPVSLYCRYPFAFAAYLLSWSPTWLKNMAISWRLKQRKVPPTVRSAGLHCMSYTFMHNALLMAAQEMVQIQDIEPALEDTIIKNDKKLMFYYGATDRWTPQSFYFNLKKKFPAVDIRLCQNNYAHDFVIDSSEGVAEVVLKYLSEHKIIETNIKVFANEALEPDCLTTVPL